MTAKPHVPDVWIGVSHGNMWPALTSIVLGPLGAEAVKLLPERRGIAAANSCTMSTGLTEVGRDLAHVPSQLPLAACIHKHVLWLLERCVSVDAPAGLECASQIHVWALGEAQLGRKQLSIDQESFGHSLNVSPAADGSPSNVHCSVPDEKLALVGNILCNLQSHDRDTRQGIRHSNVVPRARHGPHVNGLRV